MGVAKEVAHWAYECASAGDKLLAVMAMLKLGLVRKKVLVFVNTVDTGYRVKLFLESFGIRAALLNAEMPLNSRSHCLAAFNRSMFDYLIATDDVHAAAHDAGGGGEAAPASGRKRKGAERERDGKRPKKGAQAAKDEEFGVTRGVDFKAVRTVINYDLPSSLQGYVHRVGRTGRAGEAGAAITLFTPDDLLFRMELEAALRGSNGEDKDAAGDEGDGVVSGSDDDDEEEEAAARAKSQQGLQPFTRLSKPQLEALRYRGEDVARAISRNTIKDARARELKAELLNNERLKEYFEEHAAERTLLRHDKALHKTPQAAHLKHVPAYLRAPGTVAEKSFTGNAGRAPLSHKKARKLPGGKAAALAGTSSNKLGAVGDASGREDPLKAVKGFVRAPRRGGSHADEELTELEKRAMEKGRKEAKKKAKAEGGIVQHVPKGNVRKFKRRR
uniref:RNA helicase n=1 Tax=Chlamydomonas leiostraca TaxID=1034604 RepID=A0A7S0S3C6_9CHLO|mmetsp:Transcript_6393/g.15884  ORF Transcript_6393/g.15884 Transcript_6393/m.15884 type:complete len:445 (+) Transcript_6393:272-1606(+)